MSKYGKFIAQVFFVAVSTLVAALVDDRVDASEWINVLIAVLGAVSVLGAGELPAGVWKHMKTIVAGASAAAMLAVSYVSDGWFISTTEWLQILLAVMAAVGVGFAPGPKVVEAPKVAGVYRQG